VYDTNIIISGTLIPDSIPASLLALALQGAVQLYLSPAILTEYREVLLRPKFGFQPDTVRHFLNELQKTSVMVCPTETITVSPDEADNRFLECAITAKANFLVTGNTKHFPERKYRDIRIVTPADFVTALIN